MDLAIWAGFILLILALLALDLGVFHREAKAQSLAEALAWSSFWIALALAFNGLVYFLYEHDWAGGGLALAQDASGHEAALAFFAGYVLEKSLSLDNIFVIALIFTHFRVPLAFQHRILFWGVCGALVMRGAMIAAGAKLIERFTWTSYAFGALLLVTAVRLVVVRHESIDPSRNLFVRLTRRVLPVTDGLRGQKFFVRENGVRMVTPLFVALVMVESADLVFAVDSVPAIFAVTNDPFLVYSSNVFAILGLRSLYFALAPLLDAFRFLRPSLVLILAFVGFKMLALNHLHIPVSTSVVVILSVLAAGVLASILIPVPPLASPVASERERLLRATVATVVRAVVLVVGGTVVVFGAALLFLPVLGKIVIVAGLSVLATQFVWARSLLSRLGARRTG